MILDVVTMVSHPKSKQKIPFFHFSDQIRPYFYHKPVFSEYFYDRHKMKDERQKTFNRTNHPSLRRKTPHSNPQPVVETSLKVPRAIKGARRNGLLSFSADATAGQHRDGS